MNEEAQSDGRGRAIFIALFALAGVLFLGLRVALIARRDPDIDEIFTTWIVAKDLRSMMQTLRFDSGPPLYYFILHAGRVLSAEGARLLSLLFGVLTAGVLAASTRSWWSRVVVIAMLAVYPQHVFFSAEARTYALCALGVGVMTFAIERWLGSGEWRWLATASLAILATAYAHYYGVLFFPVPLACAIFTRAGERGRAIRDSLLTLIATSIAYVPGFLLAAQQRTTAVAWMRIEDDLQRILLVAGSFGRIGFDARHHFANPLLTALVGTVSLAMLAYALWRTRMNARARLLFTIVAVPIVGAIAVAAAGVAAYFPIRFESLLSVPVILWLFVALHDAPRKFAFAALGCALAAGLLASADNVVAPRVPDSPQRTVARLVRLHADPHLPIVVSGLSLLEIYGQRDAQWQPRLFAFPHEYGVHPGLHPPRTSATRDLAALDALPKPFLWVGEARSAEASVLHARFPMRVVASDRGTVAALVYNPTPVLSQPALMR